MLPISDESFKKDVLEAKGLVLVDFWAPWCAPCRNMMPLLEAALTHYPHIKAVSMNIDDSPETPAQYNVMSIPTLIVFDSGQKKVVQTGSFPDEQSIKTWLDQFKTD